MKQLFLLCLLCIGEICRAQSTQMEITLQTPLGDMHKNVRVTMKDKSTGVTRTGITSKSGIVRFVVEKGVTYEIKPDNYYQTFTEHVGNENILVHYVSYRYAATPDNPEVKYKLPPELMAGLANMIHALPDTFKSRKPNEEDEVFFARLRVQVSFAGKPIVGEKLYFTLSAGKTIVGVTDDKGKVIVYLPKGDTTQLHFTYDRNYRTFFYYPSMMEHITDLEIEYLGTVNIIRLAKEREERMKREKERLEKERLAFEAELKRRHETKLEGLKKSYSTSAKGSLISSVFNRNKWGRKLVVVDVTGSMDPYIGELMVWLKLNFEKEKGIQFVFFNDGDNKADELKKPGKTGGVYYIKPKTYNELVDYAAMVASKGYGGDAPENNCEALLKALQLAKDYDEIVMVADSYAAINDMELVSKINKPVRTILCGMESNGFVEPDYLLLTWKTKGSIHTIERDITNIAVMMDGKVIELFGRKYRLLNGRFFPVNDI